VKQSLNIPTQQHETLEQAMAQAVTTPEYLSAAALTILQNHSDVQISEMVAELSRQTAAMNNGDMTRMENMLLAQAHTLDGLFARLTTQAFTAKHLNILDQYLRLALKAQNQARATLQTLAELKAPKQVAFVQQANIGNQVQVNNGAREQPERTRKTKKAQNELLEAEHGERLDTGAPGSAGGTDPAVATVAAELRPEKPGRQGRRRA
jgi:hypothetical protein